MNKYIKRYTYLNLTMILMITVVTAFSAGSTMILSIVQDKIPLIYKMGCFLGLRTSDTFASQMTQFSLWILPMMMIHYEVGKSILSDSTECIYFKLPRYGNKNVWWRAVASKTVITSIVLSSIVSVMFVMMGCTISILNSDKTSYVSSYIIATILYIINVTMFELIQFAMIMISKSSIIGLLSTLGVQIACAVFGQYYIEIQKYLPGSFGMYLKSRTGIQNLVNTAMMNGEITNESTGNGFDIGIVIAIEILICVMISLCPYKSIEKLFYKLFKI